MGQVLGCNGRRLSAHISVPFCAGTKCRRCPTRALGGGPGGRCLKCKCCRGLQCDFRCQSRVCTKVATRGSTKRPFFAKRGGGNCSFCSLCLLVHGVNRVGALTLNGCHIDCNCKLIVGASFKVKGATALSALKGGDQNVHGRSSASRCGCFRKVTIDCGLTGE